MWLHAVKTNSSAFSRKVKEFASNRKARRIVRIRDTSNVYVRSCCKERACALVSVKEKRVCMLCTQHTITLIFGNPTRSGNWACQLRGENDVRSWRMCVSCALDRQHTPNDGDDDTGSEERDDVADKRQQQVRREREGDVNDAVLDEASRERVDGQPHVFDAVSLNGSVEVFHKLRWANDSRYFYYFNFPFEFLMKRWKSMQVVVSVQATFVEVRWWLLNACFLFWFFVKRALPIDLNRFHKRRIIFVLVRSSHG